MRTLPRSLLLLTALLTLASRGAADPVTVRLGTILPSGTAQHAVLQELAERWRNDSAGTVRLTLYPDGRLGGEAEMVKKLRIRQLNAGLFSAVGLAEIDRTARGLQVMPLTFRSWEEVDFVRGRVRSQIEASLRAKGYELLFWADAGWVTFFAKTPAVRPEDFRRLKMFAWAGDSEQLQLMQAMGCHPVPLETGDILLGLNTDMINTVALPPLVALAAQVHRAAPHMLVMNWAPIVGACVIRRDVWLAIPPEVQTRLQAAAASAGEKIRQRGRLEHEEAIRAMQQHGLQVHALPPEAAAEWEEVAASLRGRIRGAMVPSEIFDAVQAELAEFRATRVAAR
jgi:TRAP-type C4-dicarboxylate transport system substrate-binding protein